MTKTLKSKMQLMIHDYQRDSFMMNPDYEEFKDKKIMIILNDNYKIWEIIQNRLS